jgi:hypothetical protein
MKIRATVEVEFEGERGTDEHALRLALMRALSDLRTSIEHGKSTPAGVKRNTVKAHVTKTAVDT